jgi:hypothetical protein
MRFQNFLKFFQQIGLCLGLILFISACGEDDSFTGKIVTPFQITGTASLSATDGSKVDCSFDLIFDLAPGDSPNEYEGVYRGVLRRAVQTSDGKGFSYSVDVNATAEARLFRPDIARIEVPTNGIGANSRFLREFDELVATMDDQGRGTGTWICAPLDIDINGYKDNVFTINGQFLLQPISGS